MRKLKSPKNKILIVAAHPDDEILGCGGSIIKWKDNYDINVIFMTDGVSSRGKILLKKGKEKTLMFEII